MSSERIDVPTPWQLPQLQEADDLQHKRRTLPHIKFPVKPLVKLSLSDKINFGKHLNLTIQELIDEHPTYLEWAVDEIDRFVLDDTAGLELALALDAHYCCSDNDDDDDRRDFEDDNPNTFVLLR